MTRRLAALLSGLPRAWVAVLLVVAALDLAVVASATGPRTAEAAAAIAPLVARLAPGPLVTDGALVADDVTLATPAHALVVDRAAAAATTTAPPGRDALLLAGDGLALLVGGERWTVPYAGSLAAADLHALLAGWRDAQRGTAVLAAVLSGALTAALASAVLALGARYGGRLTGRRGASAPALRPRDALAWWAASLATASTGAAVLVLGTGGATGRTPTLVATLLAATLGVCALAAAASRATPVPPSTPAALTAAPAPHAGPEPAAAP